MKTWEILASRFLLPRGIRRGSEVRNSSGHGCLLWMLCVVKVEASASGWSPVQRSLNECGVPEYDRVASIMGRPWPASECCYMGKKYIFWCTRTSMSQEITDSRLLVCCHEYEGSKLHRNVCVPCVRVCAYHVRETGVFVQRVNNRPGMTSFYILVQQNFNVQREFRMLWQRPGETDSSTDREEDWHTFWQ
jgi:hypothetical protein